MRGTFQEPKMSSNPADQYHGYRLRWDIYPSNLIEAEFVSIGSVNDQGQIIEATKPESKPWFVIKIWSPWQNGDYIIYDGETYDRLYCNPAGDRGKYKYKLATDGRLPRLSVSDKVLLDRLINDYLGQLTTERA